MGAVQGDGADDTRAAAAERVQERRKRGEKEKAVPQLKEGACSSDRKQNTDSLRHVRRSHSQSRR